MTSAVRAARDVMSRMNQLGAAANDHLSTASRVEPTPTMRRDLADACRWYRHGLGWSADQVTALCNDYTAALQREPFDVIAQILAAEGAVCRASLAAFDKRVEEACKQ